MKALLDIKGTRLLWWPGVREGSLGRIRPALTLVTPRGELLVRFGRDGWECFSERYAGQHGIPPFWYGPGGLSIRWAPRA